MPDIEIRSRVEFVGGPFDGHRLKVRAPKAFVAVAVLPTSVGGPLRKLLIRIGALREPPRRLAVYEFEEDDQRSVYRHVGTQLEAKSPRLPRVNQFDG